MSGELTAEVADWVGNNRTVMNSQMEESWVCQWPSRILATPTTRFPRQRRAHEVFDRRRDGSLWRVRRVGGSGRRSGWCEGRQRLAAGRKTHWPVSTTMLGVLQSLYEQQSSFVCEVLVWLHRPSGRFLSIPRFLKSSLCRHPAGITRFAVPSFGAGLQSTRATRLGLLPHPRV